MSERTALYRLYDADDGLLYIGISKRFGNRWLQHADSQPWWPEVDHQTVAWFPDREVAGDAETAAIRAEHPKFNIIHSGRRRVRVPVDAETGLPRDEHPRLVRIRRARSRYDRARADFFQQITDALAAGDALPEDQRRKLGPSAIGRAAGFTREYVAKIRDGGER